MLGRQHPAPPQHCRVHLPTSGIATTTPTAPWRPSFPHTILPPHNTHTLNTHPTTPPQHPPTTPLKQHQCTAHQPTPQHTPAHPSPTCQELWCHAHTFPPSPSHSRLISNAENVLRSIPTHPPTHPPARNCGVPLTLTYATLQPPASNSAAPTPSLSWIRPLTWPTVSPGPMRSRKGSPKGTASCWGALVLVLGRRAGGRVGLPAGAGAVPIRPAGGWLRGWWGEVVVMTVTQQQGYRREEESA